ncbi:acyltransferase [Emticicia sp. 17c]|uniref:acyltransferase n=1 Tax=Emticicia sp. 17c TaxID=3127704 RepID=UPI00301C42E8
METQRITYLEKALTTLQKTESVNIKNTDALAKSYANKMNVIRFVAICSIVWCHSLLGLEDKNYPHVADKLFQAFIVQFGRIGTISFFIISGFFLNSKLANYTIFAYLKKRFRKTIMPWLIVLMVCVSLEMLPKISIGQLLDPQYLKSLIILSFSTIKNILLYTSFWFVPASLFSACIIIAFRKVVNQYWFGLVLLLISIFYGANLYLGWVPQTHTKAWLGYVFFMWAGIQLKRKLAVVHQFIEKIQTNKIWLIILLLFMVACTESIYLKVQGCTDAFGSIRMSNALLFAFVFLLLLKTDSLLWLNRLHPQYHVYGVYLIHSILITQLVNLFPAWVKYCVSLSASRFVLFQIALFAIALSLSYLLVFIFLKLKKRVKAHLKLA